MSKQLTEGLDYRDLQNQMLPVIQIDEYAAKMGDDDEIVTLSFTVKGKQAGEDLVDWFERGYDFVLDSQVSEGEVSPGKYLVFVEMNRRTSVPARIFELVDDLETLTGIPVEKWKAEIEDNEYPVDIDVLKKQMILSPHDYREQKEKSEETDLNEMRSLSGLETKKIYANPDQLLKDFISKAGL